MANPAIAEKFARFKGKRALVMGLGLWQGGVEAVKFLHRWGASEILVTDLRDEKTLAPSLEAISYIPVTLRLGEHREADFARAQVVIHSPAVRPDNRFLVAAREAGAEVTQEMSLFIEACPAKTVGITGSNGKTTTTTLTYEMLRWSYAPGQASLWTQWADPIPSSDVPDCVEPPEQPPNVWLGGNLGTPLINRLDEIRSRDIVVLELSSFQLMDWHRICKSCDYSLITNITPNHLDWHRDFAEYSWAKQAIFRYGGCQALLNADDGETTRMFGDVPEHVRLFSLKLPAGKLRLGRRDGQVVASGVRGQLKLCVEPQEGNTSPSIIQVAQRADLRLPGEFNWANAVAAAALVSRVLDPEDLGNVSRAMRTFRGVEHRLEPCGEVNGARVYNDSIATDPAATLAALSAFDKGIHLILGGGSKNIDYTELGKRIATHGGIKAIYLQGTTAPVLKAAIASAVGVQHAAPLNECATFDEACERAFKALAPGDVLLMSPASTSFYEYAPGKKFANFEERGKHFKALVAQASRLRT